MIPKETVAANFVETQTEIARLTTAIAFIKNETEIALRRKHVQYMKDLNAKRLLFLTGVIEEFTFAESYAFYKFKIKECADLIWPS
jgi:hypothetical protein